MDKKIEKIGIAILGCGTIGGAVAEILINDKQELLKRNPVQLNLKYLVDIDFTHARSLNLDESLFCKNPETVFTDPEIDIIVELVGGTSIAKELTVQALEAGKAVVTANKALMAHHGAELMALARKQGGSIAFEASCGGGIPIIRALSDGLIANRINAIYGIVNGTCNYILTAMDRRSLAYSTALQEAQADGLAEADPTLDVEGIDSAHKIAIMAALGFAQKIDFSKIQAEGINNLELQDVAYGEELGYVVKLLAIAQRLDEGLILCVRPAFISKEHPLAWVSGPFNAVSVYGHATGHTMYYGRGAGGKPTASAIIADIVESGLGITATRFRDLSLWSDRLQPAQQLPVSEILSRYYLRITALEQAGVLARIADIFGKHNISICSVLQKETQAKNSTSRGIPIIITTHQANEGNLKNALHEIDALPVIKAKSICIQIVDEYPEWS